MTKEVKTGMKLIAVKLPEELYEAVLVEVKSVEEGSVSGWVREAIRARLTKVTA